MRSRPGLSLAELVAGVFLGSLVAGIITTTLVRQQRFYRGTEQLHYVREGTRDAMEVLSTDIRGLSVDDTVRLRADSAIEFFANIGSSVVCQTMGTEVGLPSAHSSGNSLSAFLLTPDTGDLALVYATGDSGQGGWEHGRIVSFASRSLASSCPTSGFAEQADLDASESGFVVTLASPFTNEVRAGSPMRFVRRARYSLYRASDGGWYLGYRRCNAIGISTCGVIQPVSGPYRAYSADPLASGLLFEYFDGNGQQLGPSASPMTLARVDVTARSESGQQAWLGDRSRRIADSATISIAIRNGAR